MEVASRVSIIRKNPPDDFENYFIWKVDIDQNTLPEKETDKTNLTARQETLTYLVSSWKIIALVLS